MKTVKHDIKPLLVHGTLTVWLIILLVTFSCRFPVKRMHGNPDRIYRYSERIISDLGEKRAGKIIDSVLFEDRKSFEYPELDILNPYNKSVFPLDMASPEIIWEDDHPLSGLWMVRVSFAGTKSVICLLTHQKKWTPEQAVWESIKSDSTGKDAVVTIFGIDPDDPDLIITQNDITITISEDRVESPVFFQHIPLPFATAARHPELSSWLLGDISSYDPPRVVMENLVMCANCHHFSPDGKLFGMDMDFQGDKGAYALAPVDRTIEILPDQFITWNDFNRPDGLKSMGLFSRISPDKRHVVSTVQEISFFTMIPDIDFSQFFFPIKGLVACYDRTEKRFFPLHGADNPGYVQTCPEWSPDGSTVFFARAKLDQRLIDIIGGKGFITVDAHRRIDDLNREYQIRYDLYSVPFNNGKGGDPVPLSGAGQNGKSNYFPRVSPDGKWIVFTRSDTGLAIQPSSRLFIVPSRGGAARELACNTAIMNSWHSWSPNSKWIIFSSKVNTPYTQLFLSHIDAHGNASEAVLLSRFGSDKRACLVPEFVNVSLTGFSNFQTDGCLVRKIQEVPAD